MGFPLVNQTVVDLVGNDVRLELAQFGHQLRGHDMARRVGGRVDDDGFCFSSHEGLQGFDLILESFLFEDVDRDGLCIDEPDDVRIARVIGVWNDRLVSGL